MPDPSKIDLQVPITIVGAILMDKSGRRPLVMVNIVQELLIWLAKEKCMKFWMDSKCAFTCEGFCNWDISGLLPSWSVFLFQGHLPKLLLLQCLCCPVLFVLQGLNFAIMMQGHGLLLEWVPILAVLGVLVNLHTTLLQFCNITLHIQI